MRAHILKLSNFGVRKSMLDNLSDREIQNILRLKLNQPVNPLNFRALGFQGTADGTLLTRLYNVNDLKSNFVRIISLHIAYYSVSIMAREIAADNKIFTSNANSRYSMIRPAVRLDPYFLENSSSLSFLDILVDNNSLNLFSKTYQPVIEDINLDVMPQSTISDGIDVKNTVLFFNDMELNTTFNPSVIVTMFVEILNDINPLKLEQKIQ